MDKITKITLPTNLTHLKKTNEIIDSLNSLADRSITDAERDKLSKIEAGANKVTVDSAISATSTNPVQNKVIDAALKNKVNKANTDDANGLINSLSTGDLVPTDNDYFVSQYSNGGTEHTTFHRRPVKKLADYIIGKLATVATSGSYNDLSNKPTIPTTLPANGGAADTATKASQDDDGNIIKNTYAKKATTIAGYGITDAKIENGTITLGSNTIKPVTSHQSLSAYAKTTDVETKISNAVTELRNGLVEVVAQLPVTGIAGKIYFISNGSSSGENVYTEYSFIDNKWEILGDVKIDLSPYVKSSSLATVATSGSYNDLSNKPTIPSAYSLPDATTSVKGGVKIGSNITVSSGTISLTKSNVTTALGYTPPTTDTTYSNMGAASADAAGSAGLVPAPAAGKQTSFLRGDGTWVVPTNTTYSAATQSASGLMSAVDKKKLDGVAASANNYSHPANHPASMITGLATVATSGSYSDLSDKPTIPTTLPANGGNSASSDKLNTNAGSATQPVYFANGVPKATTYTLSKSVPSDAKFTDTSYVYVGNTDPGDLPNNTIWIKPDEKETYSDLSQYVSWNTQGAGFHNSLYRGKYLGSSVSAAQSAAIKNATFDDIYPGDYWTINNKNWIVADCDYYYNTGDTACTTHHVVVIPESPLYNHVMNDTNITTGAYVGSKMYTSGLTEAKSQITNAFGSSHLLTIRQYFQNSVSGDGENGGLWTDTTVWLMHERNVYGARAFQNLRSGSVWTPEYTIDTSQYAYFRFLKWKQNSRWWYWLRNVSVTGVFCNVNGNGDCNNNYASHSGGVRPAFLVI